MPHDPSAPRLAAVLAEAKGGGDAFLSSIAESCSGLGMRVGGVVQDNPARPGACRCDMVLIELTTRERIRISQDLGAHARGCRLDAAALEHMAGLVESSVGQALDLVIINKFGKREAEGKGLRQAILAFLEQGVPVLVGLGPANLEGWSAFADGYGEMLPQDREAVAGWLAEAKGMRAARRVELA